MTSQAFTGANSNPRNDDERINELWNTLDELDRVKEITFILENVPGMKHSRPEMDSNPDKDLDGTSIRNFAQAAVKRLVAMKWAFNVAILADSDSYQVRLALLKSRHTVVPRVV